MQKIEKNGALLSLTLRQETLPILACGGDLKSAFCLTRGREAFMSQPLGDLEEYETLEAYEETISTMKRLLRVEPEVVAFDLHPDYHSTRFALSQEAPWHLPIQHHHAHIASCLAEKGIAGPVIGIALDGTGYGDDGCVWGGEFLIVQRGQYQRAGHLEYMPMPGSSHAIKEPWRMALSYLYTVFGENIPRPWLERFGEQRALVLLSMMEKGLNSPLTSSCGRLFDAVSSILGLTDQNLYEGHAAILLESIISENAHAHYPFEIREEKDELIISMRPMIEAMVRDMEKGVPKGTISARFHNALSQAFFEVCERLREAFTIHDVALGGGVFQNAHLLKKLSHDLKEAGFEVHVPSIVPLNDAGLALGQALIANEKIKEIGSCV